MSRTHDVTAALGRHRLRLAAFDSLPEARRFAASLRPDWADVRVESRPVDPVLAEVLRACG